MKQVSNDEFELSTGRIIYANCLIIGINPNLELSYGYDGGFDDLPIWDGSGGWSAAEKREVADYMISLWSAYKNAHEE